MYAGSAPPPELRLAWWCGENRLPEAGGVFDQDYTLMKQMQAATNIYNALYRWLNLKGEEIHKLSTGERKIIRFLRDGGFLNG